MRKIIYLMLMLVSTLAISQNTNTQNTNCFNEKQLEQVYKGLKQGEWLKTKLKKTENALESAKVVIQEQKISLEQKDGIIEVQEQMYSNISFEKDKAEEAHAGEVSILKNQINIAEKQAKTKFWRGTKAGAVAGVAVTLIAVILIN